jgi:hypothetical protein
MKNREKGLEAAVRVVECGAAADILVFIETAKCTHTRESQTQN